MFVGCFSANSQFPATATSTCCHQVAQRFIGLPPAARSRQQSGMFQRIGSPNRFSRPFRRSNKFGAYSTHVASLKGSHAQHVQHTAYGCCSGPSARSRHHVQYRNLFRRVVLNTGSTSWTDTPELFAVFRANSKPCFRRLTAESTFVEQRRENVMEPGY